MKRIMVIGDLMLDEYIHGKVNRMSPEAPVPIVDLTHTDYLPGGAANVAINIRNINHEIDIQLMGVVGDDEAGSKLFELLQQSNISIDNISIVADRKTTVKTRIISDNKQLIRLDNQCDENVSEYLKSFDLDCDVVIFSDYDYGVIDSAVIQNVLAGKSYGDYVVIADPKKRNFWKYEGVDVFKPNQSELWEGLLRKMTKTTMDINEICYDDLPVQLDELSMMMNCKRYLVTAGKYGMVYFDTVEDKWEILPAIAEEVYDVTGAGDTVTAVLANSLALGLSFKDSVWLSNQAAGKVVGKFGCSFLTEDEFEFLKNNINNIGG